MVFCFVLLIIQQRDWTWYSQTLMILYLLFWQETLHFSQRRKRRRSHKQQLFSTAGIKSAPNARWVHQFSLPAQRGNHCNPFCSFSAGCFRFLHAARPQMKTFSLSVQMHFHLSIRFNSKVSVFPWLRLIMQNVVTGEDWRFESCFTSYKLKPKRK